MKTIVVKADLVKDRNGNPVAVEIDESHHDSGVVEPGDRISWTCDCPEGSEFRVERLHYAGDLDELVDLLSRRGVEERSELERVSDELESLQQVLQAQEGQEMAAEGPGGQEAKQGSEFRELISSAIVGVRDLKSALAPQKPRSLFADWSPPSDFVPKTEAIRSPPVAQGVGHELWKYTWRIRLKGVPDSEDVWDPCIYAHDVIKKQ